MGFGQFLLVLISGFIFLSTFASGVPRLQADEVEALREIGKKLGKKWNFTVDPCSRNLGWVNVTMDIISSVTCGNCSTTVCHVVSIILKFQSLPGVLPPELVKLPYLQEIDLSRNYLSGTIPPEWGSMKLVKIILLANRLSGPIPKEFGKMTTLKRLSLEYNQFSFLPPELGDLINLEHIMLSSNKFTGELPKEFARLTNLIEFRISDNNFTGNIPDFIQYWENLDRLEIQASGLEGPIPSGFSLLEKLTDLRISDINGTNVTFPSLNKVMGLGRLVLRSCNISGEIPEYIGLWKKIKILDLSFNKLTGEVPRSFVGLESLKFMYLTGNLLTGNVPDRLREEAFIDLSYNNFTSGVNSCTQNKINLFGTSSLGQNMTEVVPCLKSHKCPKPRGYFHINCGSSEEYPIKDITYEADSESGTASTFFRKEYWAFSSTGSTYIDKNEDNDNYIATNTSGLLMKDFELYRTARGSPLSLTYYGFCLGNGNYNVTLHFAEIIFTYDKTYKSLGRRIFDVYIQGELVLKDYNIEDKAGGAGKEKIENFPAVVRSGTLEIRFYWAGKGTTEIPEKGVYGPLISAISVTSDYKPPSEISIGAVVGIVASGLALLVFMVMGLLWWKGCLGGKSTREQDLRGLDLQTGSFTLRQIKAATNNFDVANKIGEGGFGSVYKGLLYDGTIIAVKQLSSKSRQGNREFVNEIGMISALQHPHLVKLYGCCIEGNQLLLVYEYMENNSLARALFGPKEYRMNLDWPTRHKICVGIARGLAYLHEESRLKIVHRDIKATNILLDKDLNPKISDFGLAKLDEEENTHISTRIAGTFGYMAPEYAMRGYLTDKADVYSFGIVALEIISGRSNANYKPKEDGVYLLDWALHLKEKGNLMELVDPKLESKYIEEEVMGVINIGLQCTNVSSILRPAMSTVVSMLEDQNFSRELVSDSHISKDLKFKAARDQYPVSSDLSISESQSQVMLDAGPWTGSSTSAPDLYPFHLNSQYWNDRE